MATNKLSVYKENTVNFSLNFAGTDLTGATVYFTVKSSFDDTADDSTAVIKKDVTSHTAPLTGATVVTLTPTDTNIPAGNYLYDIKLKKANGEQITVKVGTLEIKSAVTNRG